MRQETNSVGGEGFTLFELLVVIAVIAVLAALLLPMFFSHAERTRQAAERQSIRELASAFSRFKADTGYWPLADTVWGGLSDVQPREFSVADVALFRMPSLPEGVDPLPSCTLGNMGVSCWGGPYLPTAAKGGSLNEAFVDAWGRRRLLIMLKPAAAAGSAASSATNAGVVAVWSRGGDNEDSYSCEGSPPGCVRNLERMSQGLASALTTSSGGNPDDIIMIVGVVGDAGRGGGAW